MGEYRNPHEDRDVAGGSLTKGGSMFPADQQGQLDGEPSGVAAGEADGKLPDVYISRMESYGIIVAGAAGGLTAAVMAYYEPYAWALVGFCGVLVLAGVIRYWRATPNAAKTSGYGLALCLGLLLSGACIALGGYWVDVLVARYVPDVPHMRILAGLAMGIACGFVLTTVGLPVLRRFVCFIVVTFASVVAGRTVRDERRDTGGRDEIPSPHE